MPDNFDEFYERLASGMLEPLEPYQRELIGRLVAENSRRFFQVLSEKNCPTENIPPLSGMVTLEQLKAQRGPEITFAGIDEACPGGDIQAFHVVDDIGAPPDTIFSKRPIFAVARQTGNDTLRMRILKARLAGL